MSRADSRRIDAIMIGAGQRGNFVFGRYALEHRRRLRFVAVVEPDEKRRERFARSHEIEADQCFETVEQLLGRNGRIEAQAAVVATMDTEHLEPAMMAMQAGYHVLLEKPMAVTPQDCIRLVEESERCGKILRIGHVLRYTSFFSRLKELIGSGQVGDIVSVEHLENVSYWHMAHSFVRGNWARSDQSGPMLLSKCCHDLDLLVWMMSHTRPVSIYSAGSRSHFVSTKAPAGATLRCTDDCPAESSCPFSAPRFYLDMERDPYFAAAITHDLSYEGRLKALQEGPYGLCVYRTDNDVVDHQTVVIEFENGSIATLIMHGFSHEEGRTMRYDGDFATVRATMPLLAEGLMDVHDHVSGKVERLQIENSGWGGHAGGDGGLIDAFIDTVNSDEAPADDDLSSPRTALMSHMLAFAAEQSRELKRSVRVNDFIREVEQSLDTV